MIFQLRKIRWTKKIGVQYCGGQNCVGILICRRFSVFYSKLNCIESSKTTSSPSTLVLSSDSFSDLSQKNACVQKSVFFILFKLLLLFLLNWFDNFDTNLVGRKKLKCTYSPLCPPPPNASRNSYGYILKCYLNYYLHAVLGWYWVFFEEGGGSYSNFFF